MRRKWIVVLFAGLLTGCTLGPNYHRPEVNAPATFRAAEPGAEKDPSFGDLHWWEVFKDERLQELVRAALEGNFDLQQAVTRVQAARATLGVTESSQLPNLGVGSTGTTNRLSRDGAVPLSPSFPASQTRSFESTTLNLLSFELDVWGRLRRSTEAARADLLGAEETQKAVMATLVGDVASAYFTLRELDSELDIANRTFAARQETLRVVRARQDGGVATLLDLRQAEQLVDTASAAIPLIEQQREQTENRISLLTGSNPGGVTRGRSLTEQELVPEIPTGLPSTLIQRRPDILAAEQSLISANARIGVARAAYFPQLSLTGLAGGQSSQLGSLFSTPNRVWTFAPQVSQPLFLAGRLGSNVRLSEAQKQIILIQYEKVIQTAFTEVADTLIAHEKIRESRVQQESLVTAIEDRNRLAYIRYRGGVDTLLNALDSDRDLFQAQLSLSRIRLSELLNIVQVYKALGGGWQ